MIKNGYYYPDWIWKNKLHKNEETGEYEGNCVYNFIEGNRRAGKSVGVGIYALQDFFRYGYKCVLLRRFLKDFENSNKPAMENFWSKSWPFCPEAEGHELSFDGHAAYIDGVLFCYPVAINLFNEYKNSNFDNVHTIIYDEFMTEQGSRLKGEVFAVYNLYDTIARGRDDALQTTSVVFISNVVSSVNDFHTEFGIDRELRRDTKRLYRPEQGYCLEVVKNEIVADAMTSSPIGRLMASGKTGREYLGYAQDNQFKDNRDFVKKLSTQGEMYLYNITHEGKMYAVRFLPSLGYYYITDTAVNKEWIRNYALTTDDHTVNTIVITAGPLKNSMKILKNAYNSGQLYFNSMRAKQMFADIYRYL